MLVHSVFFWLKESLTDEERAAFKAGLDTLTTIESAEAVYIGTPSATAERPVVDTSYDYGLTVLLSDVPAHDCYQQDDIHTAFIQGHADKWDRVQIYDVD